MKKFGFILIGLTFFLFTDNIYSQRGKEKHKINNEKVEYVAQQKTEELDKVVALRRGHQKKSIKKVYVSHEIMIQKLRKNQKREQHGLHKKIKKREIELDHKIKKLLTHKQKERLEKHKKTLAVLQLQ